MYVPTLWMILPFGLLLACMAVLPLHWPRWWEKHYAKLALSFAAVTFGLDQWLAVGFVSYQPNLPRL